MNRKEVAQIIATLKTFYPNGETVTDDTIDAWEWIIGEYDYKTFWACMKQVIDEWDGYTMPPPAAIIKKMKQAEDTDKYIDLWNEADKLICKGTILTNDEFKRASPEVQRYFGSVARIRELALMPLEQTANERARFLKQIPEICEHYKVRKELPAEVVNVIDGITERKQLE